MPYGILDVEWDVQITQEFLDTFFRQLTATKSSESSIVILYHKPADTQLVLTALTKTAYSQASHFFWHKTGHSSPTPQSSYTSTVEMGTMAFQPDRTKCNWNLGADPRGRHNFIECPAVTTYLKHADGSIVNPCQKPPELSQWLVSNHIKPGTNVLVIGAGAGGDVLGALEAGADVVAIEKDHRQFVTLGAELCRLAAEENEDDGAEDYKESDKKSRSNKSETRDAGTSESTSKQTKGQKASNQTNAPDKLPDCLICGEKVTKDDVAKGIVCESCDKNRILHEKCVQIAPNGKHVCPSHAVNLQSVGPSQQSQTY